MDLEELKVRLYALYLKVEKEIAGRTPGNHTFNENSIRFIENAVYDSITHHSQN